MNVEEAISKARDAITVGRVYGEPYKAEGVTVIPAAAVGGGGGGGAGEKPGGEESGSGAGFGIAARPVGAYVIDGHEVRWVPAPDVNRIAAQVLAVLVTALVLVLRRR